MDSNHDSFKGGLLPSLVFSLVITLLASCTPFKLDQYTECQSDQDCTLGFERCDINQFCVTESALCAWFLSDGTEIQEYSPPEGQMTLGVLAKLSDIRVGGQRHSALLGLQTGASTILDDDISMIVCDPDEERRDNALQVFQQYRVQTVIAQPLSSDIISEDLSYISIGLDDDLLGETQIGSPAPGWLNLRPPRSELQSATGYLSSYLLDSLRAISEDISILLSTKTRADELLFKDRLIWRLSPYEGVNFRTLSISYERVFKPDESVREFLNDAGVSLSLFVSPEPSSNQELASLVNEVKQIYVDRVSALPFHILSMMWDLGLSDEFDQEIWPSIQRYSVAYGQYPHHFVDPESSEYTDLLTMYDDAITNAGRFDRAQSLPSPYFGLAFDAGVLSALLFKLAPTSEEGLHSVLESFSVTESNGAAIPFIGSKLREAFASTVDGLTEWKVINKPLIGLSGPIKNVKTSEDLRLPPILLCRKDQSTPAIIPLLRREPPKELYGDLQIYDSFLLNADGLSACDGP